MSTQRAVLIIDDDPDELSMMTAALPGPAWQLQGVAAEEAAISLLKSRAFDAILISLNTPATAWVDSVRRVRRLQPSARVILITTGSTSIDVIWSIREDIFSYFSKPFVVEALVEMVTRAAAAENWENGIEVLSARPDWISLRLRCRMLTADRLVQFLREVQIDLPPSEREDLGTAFREMLLNAIEHGGLFNPARTVTVSRFRLDHAIVYLIQDPGPGFSFDDLLQSAISNPPESPAAHMIYRGQHGMRPGGFGILMARKLADELIYSEKGNEVLLVKYLDR